MHQLHSTRRGLDLVVVVLFFVIVLVAALVALLVAGVVAAAVLTVRALALDACLWTRQLHKKLEP